MSDLLPKVTISVVTWNSAQWLATCLESVNRQSYGNIDIIVVDNASTDSSVAIAREYCPHAHIVLMDTNTGFCVAHNAAIRLSQGQYFMPLNPDIRLDTDFVSQLVTALQEQPEVGTAVGKLYLLSGETSAQEQQTCIDETGLFLNHARRQYLRGFGEPEENRYDTPDYVFGASGAAPLYRRAMLEDICVEDDYFDRDFFAHKEDVDLSWRAQLLGWKAFYVPSAIAYHQRSFRPTSKRANISSEIKAHAVKNRYLTILKNEQLANFWPDLLPIVFYDLQIVSYLILFERRSLRAFLELFRLLPRMYRRRKAIMKRCRVKASYIRSIMHESK